MADSTSLRVARHRRHRSGDHSICKPGNCRDARPSLKIGPLPADAGRDLDPDVSLRNLAARLEAVSVADPANVAAAKVLMDVLVRLQPSPTAGVDAELKLLMGELSRPVQGQDWPAWNDDGA